MRMGSRIGLGSHLVKHESNIGHIFFLLCRGKPQHTTEIEKIWHITALVDGGDVEDIIRGLTMPTARRKKGQGRKTTDRYKLTRELGHSQTYVLSATLSS